MYVATDYENKTTAELQQAIKQLTEENDKLNEAAPKEEAPKEEAPKEEAPKEEAPKEEAPKEEAPKEEAPKEEAPKEEAPKAMNETTAKEIKELKEKNNNQTETIKTLTERNRVSDIDAILSEFSSEGVPPVVIERARELMLTDKEEKQSYKFSEMQEDGKTKKDVQYSLSDCIISILETVPQIELSERSVNLSDGSSVVDSGSDTQKDIDVVKKYAEDNKMSFKDAMNKCLLDGTVKPVASGVPTEN